MTNNVSNVKQIPGMSQGGTKIIQLQSSKPILTSANVTLVPQSIVVSSGAHTPSISSVSRTTGPNVHSGSKLHTYFFHLLAISLLVICMNFLYTDIYLIKLHDMKVYDLVSEWFNVF